MPATSINRGVLSRIGAGAAEGAKVAVATVSQILAGALNNVFVTPWGLTQAMKAQTLADASTITWDMALGWRAKLTILASGHTVGQPTNLVEGATGSFQAIQSTGSMLLNWAACWDFGTLVAPTLSTGAGKRDMVFWECVDAVTPVIRATYSKAG